MPDHQISLLHKRVQELFPSNNVYSHFVHPKVLYPGALIISFIKITSLGFSKQPVEYQVFIPSLKIAFEYSTIERSNIWGYQDHLKSQEESLTKKELSKYIFIILELIHRKHGITLIEIPYYWDMQASSLKKVIQSYKLPVFNSEDVEK